MESLPLTAKALRLRRVDDEAVASRVVKGDPVAFFELHRRFRKRVQAACARTLHDPVAAEDAVQETFMRVLRAAPQAIENTEAWLLTIARNVCIDITRKPSRIETPADTETGAFAASLPVADTATELLRRENARQVFLALRRLPTRYRTALTLREFHGMSSAEIAEAMNISLGAVDSLVSRARDAFGTAYAEASGLPTVCRENVERIYRDLGSGLEAAERAELEAHVSTCPRCLAEYRRAKSPRYARGLMPLLAAKVPSLGLLADALTRAAEAPSVMQSFPAVTATAVATIGAAVVLSPAVVRSTLSAPPDTDKPAMSTVAAAPASAGTSNAGRVAAGDGDASGKDSVSAGDDGTKEAEASKKSRPVDYGTVAATDPATEQSSPSDSFADDASDGDGAGSATPPVENPQNKPEKPVADKPEKPVAPEDPAQPESPAEGEEPLVDEPTEEEPSDDEGGWGDVPDGTIVDDLESVPTETN